MLPSHFRKTLGLEIGDMVSDELTTFREAMLRAGMACLIGKATNVDLSVLGDTPIPINASQQYSISKVVVLYTGTGEDRDNNGAAVIRTGPEGTGEQIVLGPIVAYLGGNIVSTITTLSYPNSMVNPRSDSTLYVNVNSAEGFPITFDVLVYGIYVNPA